MEKARDSHRSKGFTLLELMVVISILAILMGMVASVIPSTEQTETISLVTRLKMAVETYRDNFYAYPRAKDNTYFLDDGQVSSNLDFYKILTARDMTRRDGKYIDQLYEAESESEFDSIGGSTYFIDGWGEKIIYYSGIEVAAGSPQNLPLMLGATGHLENVQKNLDNLTKLYRPSDYFFLGSAGADREFQYQVVAGTSRKPENYRYQVTFSSQMNSGATEDDDDIWNYNLSRR